MTDQESFYRDLVEHAGSIIVCLDTDGRLTFANESAARFFGYERDELLGRPVVGTILPETDSAGRDLRAMMDDLCRHPAAYPSSEHESITRDGRRVWVAWTNAPVYGSDGRLTGVLSTGNDVTDRRYAEEALRASQEHYRHLFNSADDMIVLCGITPEGLPGRLLEANDATWRTLGYDREALLQFTPPDLLAPESSRDTRGVMAQLARTGDAVFERLVLAKDGRRIPAEVSCHQYELAGEPVLLLIARDITARKEAGRALQAERDRAQQYLDIALALIVLLDAEGRIRLINAPGAEMLGWTPAELTGRNWFEVCVPPDMRDAEWSHFRRTIAGGRRLDEHFEGPVVTRSGERRSIAWHAALLRDEAGSIAGGIGFGLDITEQRKAQQEQRRLLAAVEQTGEAVLLADPHLRLTYVNPAFEAATGYSAAQVVGQPVQMLCGDDPGVRPFPEVRAHTEAEEPWSGVFPVRCRDGTRMEVQATLSPLRDSNQQVNGWVVVARDITEQLALEEELRQAQKLEAIGALAGGVAHDFNNLLAGIIGQAGLLLMRPDLEKDQRNALELIERSANQAADLTRQLLGFARKGPMQRVPVDLERVVSETAELLRRTLPKNVEVSVELGAGNGVVVGDPTQLMQVVLNLAVNARDAMPHGGRLRLSTASVDLRAEECAGHPEATPGPHVELVVADTGEGIPPDVLPRVFEPFFTTKPEGQGTGVGLAAVYGIVARHRGLIEVQSEVGEGTRFRVCFPASGDGRRASSVPARQADGMGRLRVLVVDDDDAVRQAAVQMLGYLGHEAVAFADAERAVDEYRATHDSIDVVLLDLVMPSMSGELALRALRQIDTDVRVIVCSGFAAEGLAERVLGQGAAGLLKKPFRTEELAAALAAATRRQPS